MNRGSRPVTIPESVIERLGTVPDSVLAKVAGVSAPKIARERARRGIERAEYVPKGRPPGALSLLPSAARQLVASASLTPEGVMVTFDTFKQICLALGRRETSG